MKSQKFADKTERDRTIRPGRKIKIETGNEGRNYFKISREGSVTTVEWSKEASSE